MVDPFVAHTMDGALNRVCVGDHAALRVRGLNPINPSRSFSANNSAILRFWLFFRQSARATSESRQNLERE